MKITKQRLQEIIKEEIEITAPGLGKDVRFTAVEGKRTDMSMRALSPEDFVGAGIEDLPDEPAEDDTRDRAFASPKERLFILMRAREALSKMDSDELAKLSLSLDAPMLATLQHILANPMYAPIKEEPVELEEQRLLSDDELRAMPKEKAIAILMGPPGRAKAGGYMSRTAAERWLYGRGYSAANQGLPSRYRSWR